MSRRRILTGASLVCLLGFLIQLVYTRGFGRLGATPAPLAAPFTTEEAWVVAEIVRDITEMSAYPQSAPPTSIEPAPNAGIYRVVLGAGGPLELDLRDDLWSPAAFAALAREAFGGAQMPSRTAGNVSPVHPLLVELTPSTLVAANAAVSQALRSDIRDVAAHEAAALTLAGFALRESAARMADTRWAMNRMTAHLAIATALRGNRGPDPGLDARLAEIALLTLTNRQRRAMRQLDAVETGTKSNAVAAWARAIRLRITEDWRLMPDPAKATRLEQREYFRARRATVRLSRGTVELERLGVSPEADWIRIINNFAVGVQDGALISDALDMERAEYEDVFMRMHGRAIDENPARALNTDATGCVSGGDIQVLPWGAWAEFAQRHISVVIGRYDSFLRHSLGAKDAADRQKLTLKRDLGDLWIFPTSTIWWTKGPRGLEADFRYIDEAVDSVLAAPHRVTAMTWSFLETGTKYEPVRRGMPPPKAWFFSPAPRTAYEAAARVKDSGHGRNPADMLAMMTEAPYDYLLASEYLTAKYGQKAPIGELERLAGARMQYDLRPVTRALEILQDDDRRVPVLEASCGIAASQCAGYGFELAKRGREVEAAQAYEQAFADPTLDAVALSNWSRWLVRYYAAHNRIGPALQLAQRSAKTGSFEGLATAAHLYEQLGREADAEQMYRDGAQRYDNLSELLGFYYRAVEIRKESEYQQAWEVARERLFPHGLINTPLAGEKPSSGVYIENDSEAARRVGLRAGDIIVAVDGWHVTNLLQYRAVRAFPEEGKFSLTVWRGNQVTVEILDRRFVPDFRVADYPVRGWIER